MKLATCSATSYSRDEIKRLTFDIVQQHVREKGWSRLRQIKLDVQEIYESVLYPRYEYDVDTTCDLGFVGDMKVLGKTIPQERIVLVDRSIAPPNTTLGTHSH